MFQKNKALLISLFILIFQSVVTVSAQQQITSDNETLKNAIEYLQLSLTAQENFHNKNYKQAAELLEKATKVNPSDGNNWLLLANAYYELKEFQKAIPYYQKASDLGFYDSAQAAYQIARCYAILEDKENTIAWLNKSLQLRYRNRVRISRDEIFKFVSDDPRFYRITGKPKVKITNRAKGWETDLDYLISEAERVHYRYSREPLPAEFSQLASDIRRYIPRLSDSEIVIKFQRLISKLGDGHSLILPFGMKLGTLKNLPLSFYFFSDGLFIVNASPAFKNLIGRKVIKFGQTDVQTALNNLDSLASHDNPSGLKWVAGVYLTFPDYLKDIGAINDREQVSLLLENTANKTREEVKISPVEVNPDAIDIKLPPLKIDSSASLPLYLSRVNENYWFQKLDGETVYFQFNQTQNQSNENLADFSIRLRQFLNENNIKNLIIDVRHNNGGEATLLRELYRTLINFETTRNNAKIYVIIGRDTFSAAQTFVSTINHLTSAIYVGEPSGSKPNRVGDEAQFMLPYSGVLGQLASGYNQAANKDTRIWISPDIPIELSSADYFSNRDPILETVLQIIKGKAN